MQCFALMSFLAFLSASLAQNYKEPFNFDFLKLHPRHLMVLSRSPAKPPVVLTMGQKDAIVNKHNAIRNADAIYKVILKMRWDDELEGMARGWAAECMIGQSEEPDDFSLRKNLPWYDTSVNSVSLMFSEDVERGVDKMASDKLMRKQMTPTFTSHVGCGVAYCGNVKHMVCVYAPRNLVDGRATHVPTNIPAETVSRVERERQEFCSSLDVATGHCEGKLLACNIDSTHSDICHYGFQYLNMDTCQCTCTGGMQLAGPDCSKIECEDDPTNLDTHCNPKKCEMSDKKGGARALYLRYWNKCQKTCSDHFYQTNCGL